MRHNLRPQSHDQSLNLKTKWRSVSALVPATRVMNALAYCAGAEIPPPSNTQPQPTDLESCCARYWEHRHARHASSQGEFALRRKAPPDAAEPRRQPLGNRLRDWAAWVMRFERRLARTPTRSASHASRKACFRSLPGRNSVRLMTDVDPKGPASVCPDEIGGRPMIDSSHRTSLDC